MLTRTPYSTLLTFALSIVLAAGGLLTLAFSAVLAAGAGKHSGLSGNWVFQPYYQQEGEDALDPRLMHWSLVLKDDGTFIERMETHVMMTIIASSRGRYTRNGDLVTLSGVREGYRDDGYVKGHFREPFTTELRYADHVLNFPGDRTDDMVFRREGGHAPRKPRYRPRPSDPKAVQIIHEMQRRYAALNSYSDEGTLTSAGAGYMAKSARFQTRFARPHKFRFQVVQATYGNEWDKDVIWSDGKKSWWYDGMSGGSEERGLGNALSTISVTAGPETMLVPALLLPAECDVGEFDTSSGGIALAGEEKVSGRDCYLIRLNIAEGMDLKLWVEKSSYLILRAFDSPSKAMITYQPKCNSKIDDSEFRFTPPATGL